MLSAKEEKLIALKVMLSVQNLSEISLLSKNFKSKNVGVGVNRHESSKGLFLVTPYAKEVSWLLVQLQYIFQDNNDSFLFLCESLELELNKKPSLKDISDFLIEESGKLLR